MHQHWQPNPGLPVQPIQPWQLADAYHAAQSANARLADAQHAFARETEQLHTNIAALEHSATIREKTIRDLQSRLQLQTNELSQARTDSAEAIETAEKTVAEFSAEYAAETKRMREVVSDHQLTAAKKEADFSELQTNYNRSEFALKHVSAQNDELIAKLEQSTQQYTVEKQQFATTVSEHQKLLEQRDADILRLREQLDATETQHKSDVESLRQKVSELEHAATDHERTLHDLDTLCDQRSAEIADLTEMGQTLESKLLRACDLFEASLADQQKDHAGAIELFEGAIAEKQQTFESKLAGLQQEHAAQIKRFEGAIAEKQQEIELLQNEIQQQQETIKTKQSELDEVTEMSQSIDSQLTDAVSQHNEQLERLQSTVAESEVEAESRKAELRDLAKNLVQREMEFNAQLKSVREEAAQELSEAIAEKDAQIAQVAEQIAQKEADYEAEIQRLTGMTVTLEGSYNGAQSLIHELQTQHQDTIAGLQQQAANHVQQIQQQLSDQIEQLQTSLASTTQRLQEAESLLHERESDQSAQQGIHQLLQNADDNQDLIAELKRQIDDLSRQHEKLLAQRDTEVARYAQEVDQLRSSLESLSTESAETQQFHTEQLANREASLSHQLEILQGVREQEATSRLQQIGELEERLAKLQANQSADSNLLEARTQELTEQLSAVMLAKQNAESEVQRLANQLSHQEAEFQEGAQRLSLQVSQLQQNNRLLEESIQQNADQQKTQHDASEMADATAKLNAQLSELQKHNKQLEETVQQKSVAIKKGATERIALRKEILNLKSSQATKTDPETLKKYRAHVGKLKQLYEQQLERCQRAEFAVTQLDRTVAWLEENSNSLQEELQREAAARRKAESGLKREADQPNASENSQAISAQIETDEKIKRLTRELDATRKIRMIERQQAEAELKKVRTELAEVKGQKARNAA